MTAQRWTAAGKVLAGAGMLSVALTPALAFSDRWDGSNAAAKFLALCVAASVALIGTGLVLASGGRPPRLRPADVAVAAYVGWLALATATAGDGLLGLSGYRPYWDGLVAAVAAGSAYAACRVAFPEAREASVALKWALRAAAAAFLVMAFASVLGWLGVPLMQSVTFASGRLGALMHQPTFLAALIAVWVVPLSVWALSALMRDRGDAWAWFGAAAVVAMLVMLAATAGRAGLAGAAAGALVFAALSTRTWRSALARAGGVLAIAALVAVPVVAARAGTDPTAVARSFEAGDFVGRTGAWGTALKAASEHPVLGSGPGTFVYAHQRHMSVAEARAIGTEVLLDPHDWVLASAVAGGWPAALAALAITASGAWAAWRSRGASRASLAVACGVVGHGVAVLATPNAFVMFPSALLLLAFAETLAPGAGEAARPPRSAVIIASAAAVLLAVGTGVWGVRVFSAEWAYGTARSTMDAGGLGRAVRLAPEVAEYARYAANAKVVAAKTAGPGSVAFSEAEDALVALAAAHPEDPLALLSAGALADLSAVAASRDATEYAGRLAASAVPVLARAVDAAPRSADARLRYAEALAYVGDTEGATAQFEEALRIGTSSEARVRRVRDLLSDLGVQ